jgi:prepilin-type N-terminal cleavage/methylation domain-containing protein/prepilin-type processing-associated H-X9-DG protein
MEIMKKLPSPVSLKRGNEGAKTLPSRFSGFPYAGARCRCAFTVLELLTAMAVIAILATLGVSVFGRGLEQGRQVKCVNNLRQIGGNIVNYAKDDDDLELPIIYEVKLQGGGKYKLFAKFQHSPSDILDFVDPSLLVCPSDKKPAPFQATDPSGKTITVPCSYGFNFVPAIAGVRFTTLDRRTILVFDGQLSSNAQASHWFGDSRDVARFSSDLGSPRHGKKFGVYFADGHCEMLSALPASGILPQ